MLLHVYLYTYKIIHVYVFTFLQYLQVSRCDICQRVNKKLAITAPEFHPVTVKSHWYYIGIDFVEPITPTSVNGNRYILTISDYFTK